MRICLWVLFAGSLAAQENLSSLRRIAVVTLERDLHHVQGIDIEGRTLWVSSVDAKARKGYLSRLDARSGKLLGQVEVQSGDRIHPGGIMRFGDSIWMPVAEYDRDGPAWIQRRDKRTLALQDQFEVKDHIGCIAVTPRELIGGSWGSRTIYRWTKQGREISRGPNPNRTEYQDLKLDRALVLAAGPVSKEKGAIEWLNAADLRVVRRIETGVTDRGVVFTNEGIALRSGKLYLLPEDAPSRLFVFEAPR